jgi:hypothetical protein
VTLLVPWLVFPLVLLGLTLGAGLALDRAAGGAIPGTLLLPAGIALLTVVAGFTTQSARTASLTVPVVLGLAIAGFGMTRRPWHEWFDVHGSAAAVAAFLVGGAPVLASGKATFAGYVKLDDTATFLALTDRALEHGRDLHGLAPSSYEATLWVNLAHGYPIGSLLPFGAAARLVGTDGAWLFQPYLAFLGALVALGTYTLASGVIPSRPWRALAALAASQTALLYGFALWGGVKELYAAALLPLVAVATIRVRAWRETLPLPVGAAAFFLAFSLGATVWLLPAGLALLLRPGPRGRAIPTFAVTMLLAFPAVLQAGEFLRGDNRASFQDSSELGNLLRPLSPLQVLGIWPAADFRTTPHAVMLTAALIGLALALAACGLLVAVSRRAEPLLVCAACAVGGAVLVSLTGSPWLSAKALAVAAPTVTAVALVGAAGVGVARTAPALLITLVLGIAASDALAAHEPSLAPHDQLAELESIGHRFAGEGPALMTEYQPYGVRHFLRRLDAEGASELRRRPIPLIDGGLAAKGESPDLDSLRQSAIDVYRTLVLRRQPAKSRPSSRYALVWHGRFYDVWQRLEHPPAVLEHVALGANDEPVATAPCPTVRRLATRARRADALVAARRAGDAGELAPVYVTPAAASTFCGRSLDWLEIVRL